MDISIIIPCYNAIGKIEACIKSLEMIDYPQEQYEVIFIDDCSKDNTYQYLNEKKSVHKNWTILQMSKNSGSPSEPRNVGVSQAKGEYIFFLDCDDEILNNTLSIHFKTAKKYNADIVRGYLIVDDGNKRFPANQIQGDLSRLNKNEMIETIICKQSTTVPSLIKRNILMKHDIKWSSDLRMGEDTVYLSDVLIASDIIIYIDHPTFIYNKKINNEASSTQTYGSRELNNHLIVWQRVQTILKKQGINYYQLRLQVGLQTAIQSMINYNSFDITENDFTALADFVNKNKTLISQFNYNERIKSVLKEIYHKDYTAFLESIKIRLVIAGYDLKFIKPVLPILKKYYQIKIDEWTGHNSHNETDSQECLKWAEIIFCEWMLGNAVWYSQRVNNHQKLFIRMHRFELTTQWFQQIDFTKVNRVFAVSVYFFEKLVEYTQIPRSQACLLPNFLDLHNYQQSDKQAKNKLFNLGIIGILPSRKGYLRALEILQKLVAKNKKYCLYVYGKMPKELDWIKNNQDEMHYFEKCEQFIQQHNLQQNVIVKGWVDVKTELKNIGFILSTSINEEIPESFHIAPADGFSAGNQGLLLDWNGVEYIYPEKYIFKSTQDIADHIYAQNKLEKFNQYNKQGLTLIQSRYSMETFVEKLRKYLYISVNRFIYSPKPIMENLSNQKLITEIQHQKLTKEGIIINIPKEYQTSGKLLLEYCLTLSENTKVNAALISLKTMNNKPITGFNLSSIKEIGLYKYLATTENNTENYIEIPLSKENPIAQLNLILWQNDAIIEINRIKLFVF